MTVRAVNAVFPVHHNHIMPDMYLYFHISIFIVKKNRYLHRLVFRFRFSSDTFDFEQHLFLPLMAACTIWVVGWERQGNFVCFDYFGRYLCNAFTWAQTNSHTFFPQSLVYDLYHCLEGFDADVEAAPRPQISSIFCDSWFLWLANDLQLIRNSD